MKQFLLATFGLFKASPQQLVIRSIWMGKK